MFTEKNIDTVESDLAKEILFGLNNANDMDNQELSTMEKILDQTNSNEVSDEIRQEINEQFHKELKKCIGSGETIKTFLQNLNL